MILKLFQCFISRVTTSETEIRLFRPLKDFKIISATSNIFEIISMFYFTIVTTSETEIKLFQPRKLFQNYFRKIFVSCN